MIAGVALGIIVWALVVAAADARQRTMCQRANSIRPKVIRLHGRRAPGRDICRYGMRHGDPSKAQRARYLRALKRLVSRPRYPTLIRTAVPPSNPPAGTATAGVAAGGTLQRIAQCESGGNPGAVSASGQYRGKYQFDRRTWAEVGGSGDPAAASEAEQDARAAALYAKAGPGRWPVCGR